MSWSPIHYTVYLALVGARDGDGSARDCPATVNQLLRRGCPQDCVVRDEETECPLCDRECQNGIMFSTAYYYYQLCCMTSAFVIAAWDLDGEQGAIPCKINLMPMCVIFKSLAAVHLQLVHKYSALHSARMVMRWMTAAVRHVTVVS